MSDIPIPKSSSLADVFAWTNENPDAIPSVVDFVNKMRSAKFRLASPTGPAPAGTGLIESDGNIIIPLPFQFGEKITAPSGGATVDTQARAAISSLLTALTKTGIHPS